MIGLTVMREIPAEVLPGLLSGTFTAHGGVIRDASGRIVSHLVTAGPADLIKSLVPGVNTLSSLVQSGQLYQLSKSVEALQASVNSVLQVAAAGALLSGVGLAVSAAGFAYMRKRFDALSSVLDELIKQLEAHHLAILKGAMQSLQHAELTHDENTKRAMLLDAKRDFQVSAHHYLERMRQSVGKSSFVALEDSFAVSFLGSSLAASELRMHAIAATDFSEHVDSWGELAREHVSQSVLRGNPSKLLDPQLVHAVPTPDLIEILDFVETSDRQWEWIDELRIRAARSDVAWWRRDREDVEPGQVQMAKRLSSRGKVLEAQATHFRYLAERSISSGDFTRAAQSAMEKQGIASAYVVAA